jgi:uncharacterized pyridoxamine 5'-phosphate oxidase family protein
LAVKKKSFEVCPQLINLYKTPDNPILEVFYISEGEATIYSFFEAPKTFKV